MKREIRPQHERDAPIWVKKNERGRTVEHDHLILGKLRYVSRIVRDEKGLPVTVPRTVTMAIGDILSGVRVVSDITYQQAKLARSRGAALTETMTWESGESRILRERVAAGRWANRCTAGERVGADDELVDEPGVYAPCTHHLVPADFARRRGEAGRRDKRHRRARTRAHTVAGAAVKSYNSGSSVDTL